jgi:hypothetical protein
MLFTPTSSITVDAVGIYDIPGEIPASGDTIALYNSAGVLLAPAIVVLPTDPVVDGYYYQATSDIVLSAGATYTLVEFGTSGEWAYGGVPTTSAGITYDGDMYSFATSLTFPTSTSDAPPAYYGPNIFFVPTVTAVPEPASLLLVGSALLALGGALRHKFLIAHS